MITIQKFGTLLDGRDVKILSFQASNELSISLLNYGATLQSFRLPNGHDIVLGFDSLEPYLGDHPYFGAAIGRVSNRIAKAKFNIDGQSYDVCANEGEHALHSGPQGFEKQLWDYTTQDNSVSFHHISPAGYQGYPGTLSVTFTYTLSNEGLRLDMQAITDAATPVSLTQHNYFNLGGTDINEHDLSIKATEHYLTDGDRVNTGHTHDLSGGDLDFSEARKISTTVIDDHFIVEGRGMREMARLLCPNRQTELKISSDLPGLQIYTGDGIKTQKGKSDALYNKRAGIAFEPQYPPNAVNLPHLPDVVLRSGKIWKHSIFYQVKPK